MIGNNQAQALSVQTGTISSIYQSFGFFPNQSIRISLNSRGGSSGSPVCDAAGRAVALQCGGDDTFAHALPIKYIQDALAPLNKQQMPQRRDTGAMVDYYSLDRAVRFCMIRDDASKTWLACHRTLEPNSPALLHNCRSPGHSSPLRTSQEAGTNDSLTSALKRSQRKQTGQDRAVKS